MFFPFLKNMRCPAQTGKGKRKEGKGESGKRRQKKEVGGSKKEEERKYGRQKKVWKTDGRRGGKGRTKIRDRRTENKEG